MRRLGVALALVAMAGCGDDDEVGSVGPGTVTEAWAAHCVATFTADHTVIDGFDEPALTIRAGEAYLLSEHRDFGGEARATILYLTPSGPLEFDIEVEGGDGLPFESNCAQGAGEARLGIFSELVLYADEAGSQEVCRVPGGQVLPASNVSSVLRSGLLDNPAVYEVEAPSLAEVCDGRTTGFVRAPQVRLGSTFYVPRPYETFLTPPASE